MKITTETHLCDRCEADMGNSWSRISRRIGFWIFSAMTERDICTKCRQEFDEWYFKRPSKPKEKP